MIILHFSDLHIKLSNDERYNVDLLNQLRFINTITMQYRPNYIFFAGDLFDKKEPTPAENSLAYIFLKQLLNIGCKIIMIQGNHDEPANIESTHTLQPLKKLNLNGLYIFDEEGLYNLEDIDILILPYKYQNRQECLLTLKDLHDSYTGNNLFFIGHLWINEYSNIIPASSEFNVSASWLKSLNKVKYGALGHIHNGGHVIDNFYYSGSPFRIDWGEEEPNKYISVYQDGKVDFILTPSKRMYIFDYTNIDVNNIKEQNSMIKIKAYNIDVKLIPQLENIKKELEQAGHIVKIFKKLHSISYSTSTTIQNTKKITLESYINDYVKKNDIVSDYNILLSICNDIINEKIVMETSPFDIEALGLKCD